MNTTVITHRKYWLCTGAEDTDYPALAGNWEVCLIPAKWEETLVNTEIVDMVRRPDGQTAFIVNHENRIIASTDKNFPKGSFMSPVRLDV